MSIARRRQIMFGLALIVFGSLLLGAVVGVVLQRVGSLP